MQELLELLKDGNSRTTLMLAKELGTTKEDVERRMEFLEHLGKIREVPIVPEDKGASGCGSSSSCSGCSGCGGGNAACKGCIPQNVSSCMGKLWEVVG